jgi:membrane protein DedA with SNARE-associated domain
VSLEGLYWSASIVLWLFLTGIGLPPLPEEAGILYAAGVAAVHPEVSWWMAWPAAGLGIMAADVALYGVGRLWGKKVLESRWMRHVLAPERQQRIEDHFHRHGMKFLLMARLLPPLRTGIFIVAGTIRYSFVRFMIADAIYAVVGVGLIYIGGTALLSLMHQLGNWVFFALGVGAVLFALYYFFRYLRKLELQASKKVVEAVVPTVAPDEKEKTTSAVGSAHSDDRR